MDMNNIELELKRRINHVIDSEFTAVQNNGNIDGIEYRIKERTKEVYATMGAEYFNRFHFSSYWDDSRKVTVMSLEITELSFKP